MIVNSEFDPSYVMKLKRERFTQQIRKKSLIEIFKRKRILQHEDKPDEVATQESINTFHQAMSHCVEEIRAGKNVGDNLIRANELFCERETFVHPQTVALWYPLLDKLMDLCQDKYYSVISNLIYQIMFCESDLEKTFKNYESPKLWNLIVESIENDMDYLTYENWLFIVHSMASYSQMYSSIIQDHILEMFSKFRENFNEGIVSTAIKCFDIYFEQKNVISEEEMKFIEDYFLKSYESSTIKHFKIELFDFFVRISQYANIEQQHWKDYINNVLSSEMYKDAYQIFENRQSHYLRGQICFLVLYTGFKQSYQENDINMFVEVLKAYNNESTLDIDIRSVLYWIISESLNIQKLSQIADSKLMKQIISEIPRETTKCQIEISFLLFKIVQLNKLDLTCFLLKKQGLFNAFYELWNSRFPDIQKNVFQAIVYLGSQLKYNNSYDKEIHIQFTFFKKSLNDMGILDQIRMGEYQESMEEEFNAFTQIFD
ncbi:hypothetical protein pb186bvf_013728 [Paramecium bursaria]